MSERGWLGRGWRGTLEEIGRWPAWMRQPEGWAAPDDVTGHTLSTPREEFMEHVTGKVAAPLSDAEIIALLLGEIKAEEKAARLGKRECQRMAAAAEARGDHGARDRALIRIEAWQRILTHCLRWSRIIQRRRP